jgi:hypothetical protein
MFSRLLDWIAKKCGYAKVYYEHGRTVFDGQGIEVKVPSAYRDEFMTGLLERHEIRNFVFRYSGDVKFEKPDMDRLYSSCCLY